MKKELKRRKIGKRRKKEYDFWNKPDCGHEKVVCAVCGVAEGQMQKERCHECGINGVPLLCFRCHEAYKKKDVKKYEK